MTTANMPRRRRPKALESYKPNERKEFWRLDKPDLRPLLAQLRHVPSDPMTRMALALGAAWTPQRRAKKSG